MKNTSHWAFSPWQPLSPITVSLAVGSILWMGAGLLAPRAALAAPASAVATAEPSGPLHAAVVRMLYAASATSQTLEQDPSSALLTQKRQIDRSWVRSGASAQPANVTPELTRAQERLLNTLAEEDEDYAQAIQALRTAVTALASLPDGLAALWRYNAGDEGAALTAWDRLIDHQTQLKPADLVNLRRYVAMLALDARGKGKVGTRAVLLRYETLTQLDTRVHADWMALGTLYQDEKQWSKARVALTHATQTASTDPERCEAFDELGDVQTELDDLASALKSYQTCLTIRQKLAKTHADDLDVQRDLSVSYDNVADTFAAMDDLNGALKHYQAGLAIRQKLAKAEPQNIDWQRDLGDSHMDIGDILSAQGHAASAAKSYQASVTIRQALHQTEPDNPEWQRDLIISLMKLSEASGQKTHAQRALKLVRRMQSLNAWGPEDADVVETLEQLAK